MELMLLCAGILVSLLAISVFHFVSLRMSSGSPRSLPPGKTGWPVIGESMEVASDMQKGHLEKFVLKRMAKYSPHVFKTSIFGDHVAVLCGAEGTKFLFSNTNKLVTHWMPTPLRRILVSEAVGIRHIQPALVQLLKGKSLRDFFGVLDTMVQAHFQSRWHASQVITVYPSVKSCFFALACRFVLSIEDPEVVEKLLHPMEILTTGIQSVPINLPGTRMNQGLKAAASLRSQIQQIVIRERTLITKSPSGYDDRQTLFSYLLQENDDDNVVVDCVLGMLFAGHETSTSVLSMVFKVMEDNPHVYNGVYQENKAVMQLLSWEDTRKLRYTWNVVREVMRLYSPASFVYREAKTDFTYSGYHIPKGYKLMTCIHATHKDPKYFPEPEKFDPSRFDGDGPLPYTYIPFGGGSYMCPGIDYAQLAMLVFIHNAVTRFKWESVIPDEKIIGIPFAKPANGLPVLLHPHTDSSN